MLKTTKTYILDIPFENKGKKAILDQIRNRIEHKKTTFITTPNPEFLVEASKNFEFKKILQKASISIPDGFGIQIASWVQGPKIKQRFTGVELVHEVCKIAEQKKYSVYLVGGKPQIAQKTKKKLQELYPNLNIVGAEEGIPIQKKKSIKEYSTELLQRINQKKPDILFVAFGAPRQETWIYNNLKKIKTPITAAGIGGAFDYISGEAREAPSMFKSIGLEWLYRFVFEPWRWKRILNATLVFPILFIINLLYKKYP